MIIIKEDKYMAFLILEKFFQDEEAFWQKFEDGILLEENLLNFIKDNHDWLVYTEESEAIKELLEKIL